MPTYGFQCTECQEETEKALRIAERNTRQFCGCGGELTRIVTCHIERVEPVWLDAAVNHAVPHGSDVRRPEDRNEFNRFLKENQIDHVG
ncbi:MAG: zinc ribbon domain-containing protein [Gammaproteobacteria bacterium]|nr:zinc ribbon domain-containing protein [Gammaproteobacteria bacterium]